jgi:lipopolysaccharide transport system permease protein
LPLLFDITAAPRLLWRHKGLFRQLLLRNIGARYRGSVLGLVWSFVHPLLMLAVYTFVFGVVFKARWGIETFDDNRAAYPLIMFCGMAVFNLFSESVNNSGMLIVNHAGFVKKVIFPLELLPMCTVGTAFFFGAAWFLLLIPGVCVLLNSFSWTMCLLPLTLLPVLLFTTGVSFAVAAFGVYLRDVPQFVGVATQILFFMTPVFYPLSLVPERLRRLLYLNPLTPMLEETRKILLYGQTPDYLLCLQATLFCLAVFQLGFACFSKMKKGFADVL